ncbi:cation diffusion facilitator family transporter [Paraburkholderia bannensis]|uniref:Cation diffusion facilitator family transporter n=1 Tax=Paraburkholderia bannensis TaxID=765414 RepID=A0A7W9WPH6_9BURK|nr:cation diffusion facilitator family transporter [Paraburkholderia sp. WP4_3_2]MBB6101100.1 cation diffusion facilitator family transporter [Paraburkholderia bannensis]
MLQIVVGVMAHSQALIADGVHSLSDLVSDFVVLIANRHSGAKPDADHNYGHSRYETVASLFLGALLIAVGVGMLARAGTRLANLGDIPPVHASALAVAVLVLVSKEALFRYMLREAQRVRSAMLIANAWHARSDAASSLVVAIGIVGSLAGVRLLDPIAAAIVGFMVARMGWVFGWDALQDLSDRALDESAAADLRALLLETPGVLDVHEMRTRKTGDLALVDAHILVDPFISVSEGHFIAEMARARLLTDARVLDALIHVDPEDDMHVRSVSNLPPRGEVAQALREALGAHDVHVETVTLHYLSTGLEIQFALAARDDARRLADVDLEALRRKLGASRLEALQMTADARLSASPPIG